MFKKSLTRLNFAPPSSQLFCNLIEIVKADPLPDPLFPILLNMRKSSTSLFFVWVDIIYAISHSTFSI